MSELAASLAGASIKLDEAQVQLNLVQDYVPVGNHNRPGDKIYTGKSRAFPSPLAAYALEPGFCQ